MVDRTVKVSLVAQVNGYVAGMELAASKTRLLGNEAAKLAAKRQAFESLGRPLLVFGAIAAAAVGIAVKKFADFDEAMSNVNAVTQESTANMNLLREAALEAGGRTVYTATEAANAIEELGKAGISTADILSGALEGALALAASGQLEVARAAEITATTLKQYGLDGTQAGHVSDVLSAAAGKALGSVEDLAQGLKFIGPVAASMGISVEETAAALALLADQGVIGEQAGTSLRGMLASLTSPSHLAGKEIQYLGLQLYDAQGKFKGLENLAGQLADAYRTMSDEERDASLGLIFGNQQLTSARILFSGGAEAVAEYTAQVNDAGYAARVAADRMDNLKGDVEKLGGAFDTFLIRSGSSANDAIRTLVQSLTFLVDTAGELPGPVLGAGLAIGTVAAAVALAGGALLIFLPRVAAVRAAMTTLELSGKRVAVTTLGVGAAVGAAALVLGQFIQHAAEMAAVGDALVDSLDKTTGAFTDYSREIVAKRLQDSGAAAEAEQFGLSLDTLTDAAFGNADAMDAVKKATAGYTGTGDMRLAAIEARGLTKDIADLSTELGDAPGELEAMQAATEDSADAYQHAAEQVASMQQELSGLIETINKANGIGQDAVSANASYQAALSGASKAIKEFAAEHGVSAKNVDQNTAAGSKNAAMFADLAKKSQDAAKAQYELDGNTDSYVASLEAGREALYDQIVGLTGSADAAANLTNKIYAIPSKKEIEILASTSEANARLTNFFTLWNGRTIRMSVKANGTSYTPGFADGGYTGPGGKYQVAGMVHANEFVSTSETLAKPENRAALEYMHAGGSARDFAAAGPSYSPAPPARFTVLIQSKGGIDLSNYIEARIVNNDLHTAVDVGAGGLA